MTVADFSDAELFQDAVQKVTQSFLAATELDSNIHPPFILSSLLTKQFYQWQIIADFSSDKGLPGLVDVMTLFCESFAELLEQDQWLTEQDWEYLDNWYSYSELFFHNLENHEIAPQLLACLQYIDADDAEELSMALQADARVLLASELALTANSSITKQATANNVYTEEQNQATSPLIQIHLVNLIATEFSLFSQELISNIDDALLIDHTAYQAALINKVNKFSNLQDACKTVGLLGLQNVFEHLQTNINTVPDQSFDEQMEAKLLKSTTLLIQDYLSHISDHDKVKMLLTFLQNEAWRIPLSEQQAEQWDTLLAINSENYQEQDIQRIIASVDDISLVIAKDVNPDILDSMFQELPLLTKSFSDAIQKIVGNNGNSDYLLQAQRIAHTLKGTASIAGITGIAVLTHNLEDILEKLTEKSALPSEALAEVLLDSVDCLEGMSESLREGSAAPANSLAVVQSVLDWSYYIEKNGLPKNDQPSSHQLETIHNPQPSSESTHNPEIELNQSTDTKTTISSAFLDQLMHSAGEQSIVGQLLKGKTDKLILDAKNIRQMTWQLHELSSEIDRLINIQNYAVKQNTLTSTDFDTLEMDQYNDFHNYVNRLSEVTADIRELNSVMSYELADLKSTLLEQNLMQKDVLETIQEIRLVPAQKIVSRCQRIVRQTARLLDKEIKLTVEGEQTLIDNETLNNLAEPLMHLLRNSVDHGVESKELRKIRGKPEQGHITLTFSKQGNFVHLSCTDDGGGLDREKILATALRKGLINHADIEQISENEVSRLILMPGFSTSETTTQISGRGIGMDVIHTEVKAMKGIMEISSTPQRGIKINITLPLLLSATQSILVKVGKTVFAIAEQGVKQIFSAVDAQIVEQNGQLRYRYEEKDYVFEALSTLLNLPYRHSKALSKPAILIEDRSGKKTAILVDAILGAQDLIIKSLGDYVPDIPGILGAAILGNGELATVLDCYELLSVQHEFHFDTSELVISESIIEQLRALVVDDSLSARKATAQLMMDNGFDVGTAIDGLDAIEKIAQTTPDILLVDMEMPRMNGIELAAHVRSREDIATLPIIMITSRSTEKHRNQAKQAGVNKYLTKPFSDDDLISAVNEVLGS
ncbi:MAG: response regulator [Methylococcaceae bacterium]|nr:response regulator [Methylococcaceae bacterium]